MELMTVRNGDAARPSLLPGRGCAGVHEDVLMGRDCEIEWEDVYSGEDGAWSAGGAQGEGQVHAEWERKMGLDC